MKESNPDKTLRPTPFSHAAKWVLLIWGWAVPSAIFWHITITRNMVLPYIPFYFWWLPGTLWQRLPGLFVAVFCVIPLPVYLLARRWPVPVKPWCRALFYILAALILITHLLWGGAVYANR